MIQAPLSEFADKMSEIMPVIVKEFARRETHELYKSRITLAQMLVLSCLHEKSDAKMKDLASFMKVSTAAMTGIADRLVREGYICRVYEPQDRRVIKVKLTDKGEELLQKINRQRRQMVIDVFGRLKPQDRSDYLRVITQIREILLKQE